MSSNGGQNKAVQLLIGIVGIYGCYWSAGYLQEKMLKQPYDIENTVQYTIFDNPLILLWIPSMIAWMFGFVANRFCYKDHTKIPVTDLIACAAMVIISTQTYTLAIYITNFPIVMLVKSCNLISVVLVGVFCSKVREKSLQLGPKKIIVATLITLGILLYNFGGDQKHQEKATDILGIVLLGISLLADGFLPDFQAVIKAQYQPRPMQMFEHINKWVVILCSIYCLFMGQVQSFVRFTVKYPQFGIDLIVVGTLTSVGQIFVYRMIKQFKQHIVPFVITTRKIFTVVISIVFYNHPTTYMQVLAVVIVFASASYYKKNPLSKDAIQLPQTDEKMEQGNQIIQEAEHKQNAK